MKLKKKRQIVMQVKQIRQKISTSNQCDCEVEKVYRKNKRPLFLIKGQSKGISENPFISNQGDGYMASLLIHYFCPH